ncbi:MAG: Crp/Fnr family transcriptional regulator [Mesorhizobium sp.]
MAFCRAQTITQAGVGVAHSGTKPVAPRLRNMDDFENTISNDLLPFVRALKRRDRLSIEEIELLNSLQFRKVAVAPGAEIIAEDSRPGESCMVLRGFAARSHYLRDGGRQITALHVAGDFVDLHAYLLKVMDHGVAAIGPCEVGFTSYEGIRRVTEQSPHLGRLLWLSTVIDGAIQRAWITCIGRLPTEQRMAHFFCEIYLRLEAAGIVSDYQYALPLTQTQLADLLGLSVVHINRRLQDLRSTGLVEWKGGIVVIRNFEALAELAEFDPTYLSLRVEPR